MAPLKQYAPKVYQWVDVTPATDTSAYAFGDVLHIATVITSASWKPDQIMRLEQLVWLDEDDQTPYDTDFYFFDATTPAIGTINVAPSISDANARTITSKFTLPATSWFDLGGSKLAIYNPPFPVIVKPVSGTRDIYFATVTFGTPTHTASGIKLRFGFSS